MRRTASASAALAIAAVLAGCAPTATGPQDAVVTYAATTGGDQQPVTIEVPSVECDVDDTRSSVRQPGVGSPEQGLADFAAVALGPADSTTYNLILKLEDGVYFISSKPFDITSDGLEVADLQGIVSRFEDGQAVENLDEAATITASFDCP